MTTPIPGGDTPEVLRQMNLTLANLQKGLTTAITSLQGPPAHTGWSASNVTPKRTFNADTVTLEDLADVVGTLIADLTAKGDIAP